jgi:hypothetical protein
MTDGVAVKGTGASEQGVNLLPAGGFIKFGSEGALVLGRLVSFASRIPSNRF